MKKGTRPKPWAALQRVWGEGAVAQISAWPGGGPAPLALGTCSNHPAANVCCPRLGSWGPGKESRGCPPPRGASTEHPAVPCPKSRTEIFAGLGCGI